MSEVIPAILPRSVSDLEEKLASLPEEISFLHLDVLEEDIWTDKPIKSFEVHLMVEKPEEILERWAKRGAKRITYHSLGGFTAKWEGVEVGLAVELHVPLEQIFPIIPQFDFLNLMSIAQIGAQGHPFDERIFDRIREVREKFPELKISVDGGINVSNYKRLEEAGVDRLIVGSGFKELWKSMTTQ